MIYQINQFYQADPNNVWILGHNSEIQVAQFSFEPTILDYREIGRSERDGAIYLFYQGTRSCRFGPIWTSSDLYSQKVNTNIISNFWFF